MSNQRRNNSLAKRRRSPKKPIEALSGKKGRRDNNNEEVEYRKEKRHYIASIIGALPREKTFQRNYMWSNRMFIILSHVTIPMFLKAAREDDTQWHYKYGHFCFKDLNTLIKKELVKKLHELKEVKKTCTDWIIKKNKEKIFSRKHHEELI